LPEPVHTSIRPTLPFSSLALNRNRPLPFTFIANGNPLACVTGAEHFGIGVGEGSEFRPYGVRVSRDIQPGGEQTDDD